MVKTRDEGKFLFVICVALIITLSCNLLSGHDDIRLTSNGIIVPDIVNAANHIHPWLATCVSLIFLAFIVAVIVVFGG